MLLGSAWNLVSTAGRWFLMQHAETIKQRGAESLQGVLRSRQFKDDPTAVFIVLLLERYSERLTEEQTECISQWEAELCQIRSRSPTTSNSESCAGICASATSLAQFVDEICAAAKARI